MTSRSARATKAATPTPAPAPEPPLLSPNQSATLKITFEKKGFYEYLCTVQAEAGAGNGNTLSQAARGMKGVLKVG